MKGRLYNFAARIAERADADHIVIVEFLDDGMLSGKIVAAGDDLGNSATGEPSNRANFSFDPGRGLVDIPADSLSRSVLVCADVIGRVADAHPLIGALAQAARQCPAVLLTSEQSRLESFLHESGREAALPGRMLERGEATELALTGAQMRFEPNCRPVKVAALINAFNESDIILEVLQHLKSQGVEAHVFDNWSTDGSYEKIQGAQAAGLCAHVQRYPEAPTTQYVWKRQLENIEAYSRQLDADWILHYDADELRFSPWRGVSLQSALSFVDSLGYNAVDFTLLNFRFTTDEVEPATPYEHSILNFEFGTSPAHFRQIKGWKRTRAPVLLANEGGHEVRFPGRRIFPLNFLTKHYPLRTRRQAIRKVFIDRRPRFAQERSAFGWHTQYDQFHDPKDLAGWRKDMLIEWNEAQFYSDYVVERLSGLLGKTHRNAEAQATP